MPCSNCEDRKTKINFFIKEQSMHVMFSLQNGSNSSRTKLLNGVGRSRLGREFKYAPSSSLFSPHFSRGYKMSYPCFSTDSRSRGCMLHTSLLDLTSRFFMLGKFSSLQFDNLDSTSVESP